MNKDKPPVLSDEGIIKIRRQYGGAYQYEFDLIKAGSEAQRDADVDWFTKQGHEAISYLEGYQQARQEVISKLEELNRYQRFGFEDGTLLLYKEDWEAVKQKPIEVEERPPGVKEVEEFMAGCDTGTQRLIQQAHQEIFEEIENNYYGTGELGGKPFEGLIMMPDEWQYLKAKYGGDK